MSGVWQAEPPAPGEIERLFGNVASSIGDAPRTFSRYFLNVLADFKLTDAPIRPEAAEQLRRNGAAPANLTTRCLPMGVPGADLLPSPFKIIQAPAVIAMLYEGTALFVRPRYAKQAIL